MSLPGYTPLAKVAGLSCLASWCPATDTGEDMSTIQEDKTLEYIRRIAEALEGLAKLAEPTRLLEPTEQEHRMTITCAKCKKYISYHGEPRDEPQYLPEGDYLATRCRECEPESWG